ncbi:MAG: SCO family protein [Rhodoferax sp.]|uniref:SCO family protein n=1 Tax=Rhodoferax sp. TaxID=50421 RepID=UPI003017A4AF
MAIPSRSWVRALWLTLLGVFLSSLYGCSRTDGPVPIPFKGLDITEVNYGKDFRLTDVDGRERTLADFKGKAVMLYFGFVQCPDVCPTALMRAVETKRLLGAAGDRLQVIFVTIDPERDTAVILKEYMAAFDPSFVALYGNAQRTRETADHFKVYYKKVPTGQSYTMDHSAVSYVFDPTGQLRVVLRHEQTAPDYAHDIALLLKTP